MRISGATSSDDAAPPSATPKLSSACPSPTSSPLISREVSPARPLLGVQPKLPGSNKPPLSANATRPRKNSQNDPSPTRNPKSLSATTSPVLLPTGANTSTQDPLKAAVSQKPPAAADSLIKDSQRWPVSPRLRSPPPLQRATVPITTLQRATPSPSPQSHHHDSDTADSDTASRLKPRPKYPLTNSQSSSLSPSPLQLASDAEPDVDPQKQTQSGFRTPSRSPLGLETVQEVSLPNSPSPDTAAVLEHVHLRLVSETDRTQPQRDARTSVARIPPAVSTAPLVASTATVATAAASILAATTASSATVTATAATLAATESGSELNGATNTGRKSAQSAQSAQSTAPSPPLLSRQSSAMSSKQAIRGGGTKPDGGQPQPANHMTVETEVVEVSAMQSPVPGAQASATASGVTNGTVKSLKPSHSTETIRPKKEKEKRKTRKQPSVNSGAAPSKADNFEAKIASAVDEANTSDSEETFVYDSNPPDSAERQRRFHSRTPSTTSMTSQGERNNLRSIYSVLESAGPVLGGRKGSKFLNTLNISATDPPNAAAPATAAASSVTPSAVVDDDARSTGRSTVGSSRGPSRPHHHFGRWGRSSANGHPSLFDSESPFPNATLLTPGVRGINSMHSPDLVSPRSHGGSHGGRNGYGYTYGNGNGNSNGVKRASATQHMLSSYSLDDTTGGGDDERAPLLMSSHHVRSSGRPGRLSRSSRRTLPASPRRLEEQPDQPYLPQHQPPRQSYLNRVAACLVVTIMLFLVITGAISFMFATSQPLTDIELVTIDNVLASEPELMFDITLRANNPNIVVVTIDQADLEVFAKSAYAGSGSDWSRYRYRPEDLLPPPTAPPSMMPPGDDDSAPNMLLGTITEFDSPLSFEGSFFHHGSSRSTAEVRLPSPGNSSTGGTPRWARIIESEFDLIVKGVVKYSLPLSARVRSASISGRTTVKPNAANNLPKLVPNSTTIA